MFNIEGYSKKTKIALMIVSDMILLALALWSAVALRLGTFSPSVAGYESLFVILPLASAPIFLFSGLYRAVIRFVDHRMVYTIASVVALSVLLLTTIVVFFQFSGVPRSSIIIYGFLATAYMTCSRLVARALLRTMQKNKEHKQKVAIYGAGQAGLQTALALYSGREFQPVAFFDDNTSLHNRSIAGVRVYDPKNAIAIMKDKECTQLLLAIPSSSRSRRQEIIKSFEGKGITLKTLPGMGDLVDGRVRVEDIREVGVEDLLGRDPVPPLESLMSKCITEKSVMVTGAGGSIGSELCRQILKVKPKILILFEQSEFNLYNIEKEFSHLKTQVQIVPILGNVLDQEYIEYILEQYSVNTVYHAAAYKHVPLVEANAIAGVKNNVFGTLAAARAAIQKNVETFVLISTDKAVRPTNIMGATKRLAELVLQGLSKTTKGTRFCMVRFGNVLDSSGSVVPLFKEQIKAGGPVTVTHPEVTRYFMTIPEASQLVIQAGAMGKGGDVYVLNMGESVKIVDLAKRLIEFSGLEVLNPETGIGDIAIEFVGLRPGEKLYEELLIGDNVSSTEHPRIMSAEEKCLDSMYLVSYLEKMKVQCFEGNKQTVVSMLKELVPEYKARDLAEG